MNRSIRFFESQEIIRRRYHDLHGRYPNAAKARSIGLHVEQGVNFIESATRAPISIRPLLQYYGVAALARAVTIFRSINQVESTLTPGHGLHVENWGVLGDTQPGRGFANLNVQIKAGLFSDLCAATDGLAYFYANSSRPNWPIRLGAVATGAELNFADLLGLLPDLWQEHSAWTGTSHTSYIIEGVKETPVRIPKQLTWTIKTHETPDQAKSLFPGEDVEPSAAGNGVEVFTSVDPLCQPIQLHHGSFGIGDTFLVPPVGAQVSLSTIEIYCAAAYVMSMLCRYRLSDWLAVWRGEKGDIARPVFERVMDLIQEHYLQICSDLMEAGAHVRSQS
jgi:YaaC-like Protein